MRYLLISDLHSNLEALEACLELARGKYEQALCLGDLVGYGPDPNAVVERTRALAQVIIRGNHDKACAGVNDAEDFNPLARWATKWTREELSAENFSFLRALPPGPVMVDQFQLVHGSPLDEDEYLVSPREALPLLISLEVQTVCFGHTHFQGGFMRSANGGFETIHAPLAETNFSWTLQFQPEGRYLINPGSVGQPRDGDWRAAFAIFDSEKRAVEYFRTPYNMTKTQLKMHQAGLPEPLIRRLEFGR